MRDKYKKDSAIDKSNPNLVDRKERCCGCSACYSVCPTNAIKMEEDEEGFLYPTINLDVCIKCYNCIEVCAFKKMQRNKELI